MLSDNEIVELYKTLSVNKIHLNYNVSYKHVLTVLKRNNVAIRGISESSKMSDCQVSKKKTNIKKYGCENPSQNKDIQKKKEETFMKHYNVKNIFCKESNIDFIECAFRKGSFAKGLGKSVLNDKYAKHLDELNVQYIREYTIAKTAHSTKVVDFYIPSINTAIEIYGTYWHCKYGDDNEVINGWNGKTKGEIRAKDRQSIDFVKSCGINCLILWEDEDFTKYDSMFKTTRQYSKIKSIKKIETHKSYELTVADNHNFVCNGMIKHNCRMVAIKENGTVRFVSRQGKLYTGLNELENALKNCNEDNFVLDGEIIVTNRNNIPSKEQYKATSKIVSSKDENKTGVTLNVFDYLSLEEWNSKTGTTPYSTRYANIEKLFTNNDIEPYFYKVPNLFTSADTNIVLTELTKAKEKNWEGLMLRFIDSVYEFKRSKNLLKVKPFQEMDMIIDDYEEGTNKLSGKLGAFICHIEHPVYGHIEAKVGGGYTDEERQNYWDNKDNLVGRTIEVQYFEVTENTTTHVKSVRFPVHKCIKDEGVKPNN